MTDVLEIQLSKAISSNIISRDDALFVMKIINEVGSIQKAIECMLHYSKRILQDSPTILPEYSIRAHEVISLSIIDNISSIEVTKEELDDKIYL